MSDRVLVMCEGRVTGELDITGRQPGRDYEIRNERGIKTDDVKPN